jgi:LAS superfamily LD-carboxypeptidase LdcB
MKKLFFLAVLLTGFSVANVSAQGGGMSPEQRAERQKQTKTELIAKAKITEAEADKILQIQQDSRGGMRGMRDMTPEDRKKKMDEMKTENEKKYKAIPITDDQIKAVNEYFDEQMKKRMERSAGN